MRTQDRRFLNWLPFSLFHQRPFLRENLAVDFLDPLMEMKALLIALIRKRMGRGKADKCNRAEKIKDKIIL
jgi:hypothetical protein